MPFISHSLQADFALTSSLDYLLTNSKFYLVYEIHAIIFWTQICRFMKLNY